MADTAELLKRSHAGDKEARDRLVMENAGLVWSIVRRFIGRGPEPDDLFQIGNIGLIKAIDHFDTELGVRFSTYAVPMITGEIRRFLRDDGMIKVSRPLKELAGKVGAARESWRRTSGGSRQWRSLQGRWEPAVRRLRHPWKLGRESDPSTSPSMPGMNPEAVWRIRSRKRHRRMTGSWTGSCWRSFYPGLGEKEQQIIKMRYFENMTQTVIAGRLGISQVQVSRLEKKILREMRERLTS